MTSISMTIATNDMTLLTKDMSVCRYDHTRKLSYHDKNVPCPPPKSESAGYVKVKLIASPLSMHQNHCRVIAKFLKVMIDLE